MTIDGCYDAYLAAIRAGDRHRALDAIERPRHSGFDLRAIYLDVLQPALREVGRLWQENEMSVAEEHLATAITTSAMLRLSAEIDFSSSPRPTLIAACVGPERHEIGLRMLCDFLDIEGWDTIFLGSAVPRDDLVEMIHHRRPRVVALSTTLEPHIPALRETIAAIRADGRSDRPLILAGGRPFLDRPELAREVGADFTARDAAEAVALLTERYH